MVGKTGPIVLLPAWERSYDLRIAIVQATVRFGNRGCAWGEGAFGSGQAPAAMGRRGPVPPGRFANRPYRGAGSCWDAGS